MTCFKCGEANPVHSNEEPLMSCLFMLQYYLGYFFFPPRPSFINRSTFLPLGTHPASMSLQRKLLFSPVTVLPLQATEQGRYRHRSGQSESFPRIVYKLELGKRVLFVWRPGFSQNSGAVGDHVPIAELP